MKSLSHLLTVAFSALAASGALHAQSAEVLMSNTLQLKTSLSLDRTVYFPGEAALVTITVQNPTAGPLAALAPFSIATGCLDLVQLSRNAPALMSAERICSFRPVDSDTPTTIFAAGEQRQRNFNSYDPMFETGMYVLGDYEAVPRGPGDYWLRYDFANGAEAAFRVVVPHVDAAAFARVPDGSYVDPITGATVPTEEYMHAFALRWNNQSFLCVTQSSTSMARIVAADPNGNFDPGGSPSEYFRVATSQNPVASISLTSDASGNLTLQWRDTLGTQQSMFLGTAPPAPTPRAVAVALDSIWVGMGSAQDQEFTGTVIGSSNTALTWTAALEENAPAGAQAGSVSSAGVYQAPERVTKPYNVVITARSQADPSAAALAFVSLGTQETVSTPAAPTGPASGASGAAYQYSTGGAASSLGHPVQYTFDWGDGTSSGWLAQGVTSSSHTWSAPGSYSLTAQARCVADTSVSSDISASVPLAISSSAPTLASVSPTSGVQGATVPVTLTGTNFVTGASVAVSNPWIAVSNVTVVNSTQITAALTIGAGIPVGMPTTVTVTTNAGTSGGVAFSVLPGNPVGFPPPPPPPSDARHPR